MSRSTIFLLFPLMLLAQATNREDLKPYDDNEAYDVFSAILTAEKSNGELLIADSTVPFTHCLEFGSDKQVEAAIEDYKKTNRKKWHLGYHFEMKRPYKLLSAAEAGALLQPDKETGVWRLSPSNGIHHFSAVGFSSDKNIAFVEMDVTCGGLCGHGGPYVLQKKDGHWSKYDPPPVRNADGTYTFGSICSWNY
jgi:hypothetical protein